MLYAEIENNSLKKKKKIKKGFKLFKNFCCYKPTEDNNNPIITFINQSYEFLKNQERNEISFNCINYNDNNAMYATGMFKKVFFKVI